MKARESRAPYLPLFFFFFFQFLRIFFFVEKVFHGSPLSMPCRVLPEDAVCTIASFLDDAATLCAMSATCKSWRRGTMRADGSWLRALDAKFPETTLDVTMGAIDRERRRAAESESESAPTTATTTATAGRDHARKTFNVQGNHSHRGGVAVFGSLRPAEAFAQASTLRRALRSGIARHGPVAAVHRGNGVESLRVIGTDGLVASADRGGAIAFSGVAGWWWWM
jgi:hypothetical protein